VDLGVAVQALAEEGARLLDMELVDDLVTGEAQRVRVRVGQESRVRGSVRFVTGQAGLDLVALVRSDEGSAQLDMAADAIVLADLVPELAHREAVGRVTARAADRDTERMRVGELELGDDLGVAVLAALVDAGRAASSVLAELVGEVAVETTDRARESGVVAARFELVGGIGVAGGAGGIRLASGEASLRKFTARGAGSDEQSASEPGGPDEVLEARGGRGAAHELPF
jgi:hypothetical protein